MRESMPSMPKIHDNCKRQYPVTITTENILSLAISYDLLTAHNPQLPIMSVRDTDFFKNLHKN